MELNETQVLDSSSLSTALANPEFLPWIMERLLRTEGFSELWMQQIVAKIESRKAVPSAAEPSQQTKIVFPTNVTVPNRISRQCGKPTDPRNDLLAVIKDLQISLNLTTESFLRSNKFAMDGSSMTASRSGHNRDAATLFTARRTIEDLLQSTTDADRTLVRSAACGRRLCNLCTLLADRVVDTDATQLSHVHFFAHSLHEMVVRFDEHVSCLLVTWNNNEALGKLRMASDQFYSIVVMQLQKTVLEWKALHERMIAKSLSDQQTSSTPTFKYVRSDFAPKGYLLPVPLREKRRILQHNIINRRAATTNDRGMGNLPMKRRDELHTKFDTLIATADRIESRWKELLSDEIQQVLINTTKRTPLDVQVSSKDAATNTAEVKTTDRFSPWLRAAQDPAMRLAQKIVENAVNHIVEDIENACDQIVDNIYSEEIGQ